MSGQVVLIDAATGEPYKASGANALMAGVDRSGTTSGTANTSKVLAIANAKRTGLNIQNISANPMGINEVGGAAAIGTPGTYNIPAGATFNARTSSAVSVVSGTATQAYTATEY